MTRLLRSAASCLATVLLATACTGGDPVSPTASDAELAPRLQSARGDTPASALAGAQGKKTTSGTTTTTSTTPPPPPPCTLSGTPSDTTSGECFGDTMPWVRYGDTMPWIRK
jgi:hypothetical protein